GVLAMDAITASTEGFAAEGNEFADSFAKDEFKRVTKALQKQGDSKSAYKKAYEQMKKWSEDVQTWSADLSKWAACLGSPGCSAMDLLKEVNADLRKWLKKADWTGSDAADRADRTAKFLEDYGKRIAAANGA